MVVVKIFKLKTNQKERRFLFPNVLHAIHIVYEFLCIYYKIYNILANYIFFFSFSFHL